jgi:F-type H+-transporting ATPase subunit delta
VRERVRGYTDAVAEDAAEADTVAAVAGDLDSVRALLEGAHELRDILSDSGVPDHARRGVVDDLVGGRVDADALRLLTYAVEADRAAEYPDDVAWMARRVAAVRDDMHQVGVTTVGRHAALERIDGYTTAVLEKVGDQSALTGLEDELFRFERAIDGSETLSDALTSRDVAVDARAALVADLLDGKASRAACRLAVYLTRIGRPRDYTELLNAVVDRIAAETQRRIAEVRAFVALTPEQERRLGDALSRIVGQRVEVRVAVDESVLGGFVARIGDTVIDGSARHRLDLLKERLVLTEAPSIT